MRYAIWLLFVSMAVPGRAASLFITDTITSGTADLMPSAPGGTSGLETFSLQGTDFSFTGSGNQLNPVFYGCSGPLGACGLGSQTNPFAGDIGTPTGVSVSGTFIYQGMSDNYTAVPGQGITSWVTFAFTPFMIPSTFPPAGNVTLTEPFHAAASFIDPGFAPNTIFSPFTGQGTVTLNLTLEGNPDVGFFYFMQHMHFDFSSQTGTAIPEPGNASAALLIAAIAALRVSFRRMLR